MIKDLLRFKIILIKKPRNYTTFTFKNYQKSLQSKKKRKETKNNIYNIFKLIEVNVYVKITSLKNIVI